MTGKKKNNQFYLFLGSRYRPGGSLSGGRIVVDAATGKRAIAQNTAGLLLPAGRARDGSCSDAEDGRRPARMGMGSLSSCTLSLTASQLRDLCALRTVPKFLTLPYTHIGTFGNSNPYSVGDWVEIVPVDYQPAPQWSGTSSGGTCSGVPAAAHLEIVTADYGNYLNPQRRVLRARLRYSSEDWVFDPRGPASQVFPLTVTTTFAHVEDNELVEVMPAAPNPFFKVPRDTLYPFDLDAGSRSATPSILAAIAAALCVMLLA
jgi:hypothetical protein